MKKYTIGNLPLVVGGKEILVPATFVHELVDGWTGWLLRDRSGGRLSLGPEARGVIQAWKDSGRIDLTDYDPDTEWVLMSEKTRQIFPPSFRVTKHDEPFVVSAGPLVFADEANGKLYEKCGGRPGWSVAPPPPDAEEQLPPRTGTDEHGDPCHFESATSGRKKEDK